MNGFVDIYTIIFLVIAVVVFLRLQERARPAHRQRAPAVRSVSRGGESLPGAAGDKVIDLPRRPRRRGRRRRRTSRRPPPKRVSRRIAPEGSTLNDGPEGDRRGRPRRFDPDEFLAGGKAAYEMIVTAFAEGDRKTLKQLLSREVYDGFVAAITRARGARRDHRIQVRRHRQGRDHRRRASRAATAQVTVRFLSKLISATRDKDGAVIDGDPVHVGDVTDIWTFARETTSRDPNWKLVATESVD